ncbi:hypothetical protein, partial [Curtobacterium sp. P97]|uniref:hypothetical protein n=1 Tax=Curtobacterium sp. P97 TaxID=2939562 RepID=UPI00203C221C
LVVTDPGDAVEVTPGFVVAADGSVARPFLPVLTQDGVATARLTGTSGPPALQYRVVRDGVVLTTESPTNFVSGTGAPPSGPQPGAARSGPGPVDPTAFGAAVDEAVVDTGLDPADLPVTVLGAGVFPAPGGLDAAAVTVAVTMPS